MKEGERSKQRMREAEDKRRKGREKQRMRKAEDDS